jgi:DNA-binding NarL/FixJ family response regulator
MSFTIEARSLKSGIILYYAGPVSLCEANRTDWHNYTTDKEKATQFASPEEALAICVHIADRQCETLPDARSLCDEFSSTGRELWKLEIVTKFHFAKVLAIYPLPKRRKKLTKREAEVLGLCRRGLGVEQIAVKLKMKVKTVESRLHQALLKVEPDDTFTYNVTSLKALNEILTLTELKVIELRARGLQDKEIAERLNMKVSNKEGRSETVKGHVKSAARKGIKHPRVKRYF